MDRLLVQSANILAAVPRLTLGGSHEKPTRVSTKMMCGLHTPRLTVRGFSGLASSNCQDSLARYGQDFHSEVAITVSPRQQKAKRFVPRAMLERFTASAMTAIMLAQEEARQLGHNSVGTEQILLGLIGEGTGIAAKVLKSMGINLKDARVEVEKIIGRGTGYVSAETSLACAKRLLEISLEEARRLGHHEVRTEHMLLGLLHESDGVSARLLRNLGADPSNIRKRIYVEITRAAAEKMFGRDNESLAPNTPPFTPSAKGVLEQAVKEAHQLGHNYIGCEHFLLALLHEGEGAVARGLEILAAHPSNKHAEVNLKVARLDVDTILGRDSGFAAPEISFAPSAKRLLELAVKEARHLGHDYIGPEHLVVALLREGEAISDRILEILGASCISSNHMLLEVLREGEGVVARALELLQEGEGVATRLLKILTA